MSKNVSPFNLSITRKTTGKWVVKLDGKRVGLVVKNLDGSYEPRSPDDGVSIFKTEFPDKVRAAFACVAIFGT